jgi:hypothetical protein
MKKRVMGVCMMLFLYGIAARVEAECAIEQLTARPENASYSLPHISDQRVMWSGTEDDAQKNRIGVIWLYDLSAPSEIIRVTDQAQLYSPARISGNLIGWMNDEVFLYQIDTGITTQITDNRLVEADLQLHNGQMVWASGRDIEDVYAAGEIFLYDHATATTRQMTDNDTADFAPQVYDGRVVWVNITPTHGFIRLYDGGIVRVIGDMADLESAPQMNHQWVVWTTYTDDRRDIHLYDLSSREQSIIGTQGHRHRSPSLSENGVVWNAYEGDDTEIFFYDGAVVRQLTSNYTDDSSPVINGDWIVWERKDETEMNIFQYQISTAATTQLTFGGSHQQPQLENGTIVWIDLEGLHYSDIFAYRCQ